MTTSPSQDGQEALTEGTETYPDYTVAWNSGSRATALERGREHITMAVVMGGETVDTYTPTEAADFLLTAVVADLLAVADAERMEIGEVLARALSQRTEERGHTAARGPLPRVRRSVWHLPPNLRAYSLDGRPFHPWCLSDEELFAVVEARSDSLGEIYPWTDDSDEAYSCTKCHEVIWTPPVQPSDDETT